MLKLEDIGSGSPLSFCSSLSAFSFRGTMRVALRNRTPSARKFNERSSFATSHLEAIPHYNRRRWLTDALTRTNRFQDGERSHLTFQQSIDSSRIVRLIRCQCFVDITRDVPLFNGIETAESNSRTRTPLRDACYVRRATRSWGKHVTTRRCNISRREERSSIGILRVMKDSRRSISKRSQLEDRLASKEPKHDQGIWSLLTIN